MKKLVTLLLLIVTVSVSAQKVTRDDLNKLLLKSDPIEILRDGFTYIGKHEVFKAYGRGKVNDSTYEDIILHHRNVVYFLSDTAYTINKGIETSAKEDLLWKGYNRKVKRVTDYDNNGDMIDQYDVYKMKKTVLEFRFKKIEGRDMFEFKLTRK